MNSNTVIIFFVSNVYKMCIICVYIDALKIDLVTNNPITSNM